MHARGSGAHGYFEPYRSHEKLTRAAFLANPKKRTPVFARFSTVAGGAGSIDLPRDVRGFAVKFYTEEGNFDLVGNNIPVFFIQDAMKFPDLVHAVKMEPDRGYPQAGSAHDTFWDFVSLMPETMHMLVWAMSDRTLPRSLRMMEGFGVHTFRFVNADDVSTFVKFHYRPKIGSASVLWDEACKMSGADPDVHRRDLYEAIARGDYPEWELSVQAFDQATADALDFDVLDPTKLIPEERVPLTPLGRLVLDRNPDNFFAETEQVAFHPGHVVPGIDFTNDPLLQGRLHSYLDTQLSRLGGPNFHELPINAPKCPMHNFQRDGISRHDVPKGRVNYEPSSLDPRGPRENPVRGFRSFEVSDADPKSRLRPESFADHYSQARMFFRSMTDVERRHIVDAFGFELGKVETKAIRKRMLGHLALIDAELLLGVSDALGMVGEADVITPARMPLDLPTSSALSLLAKAKPTLAGRKIGVLVAEGTDADVLACLRDAVEAAGAKLDVIAPKIGGAISKRGDHIAADHALRGAPSFFFDAVVVLTSTGGTKALLGDAAAVAFVRDAFEHAKVIGYGKSSLPLLEKAGVTLDEGTLGVSGQRDTARFIARAERGRVFTRSEPTHDAPKGR